MHDGDPRPGRGAAAGTLSEPAACLIEAVVSPFHCLYQDALEFHTQSRVALTRSEAEASRLARAALVLYVAAAEALIHQAACELGHPDVAGLLCDPRRPLPLADAWRLLPAAVGEGTAGFLDPAIPPWPQLAELLELRTAWAYPGPAEARRAYYRQQTDGPDPSFEPLQPHQVPHGLGIPADRLVLPRTGLPRDPYALRPRHLDTARGVLDAAVDALDRRLDGALTRNGRHRREPVRVLAPARGPGR